jgi:hypothetical protein
MDPIFFASYARSDLERSKLRDAMELLRERTAQKMSTNADPKDVAFIDLSATRLGEQWAPLMAAALQRAKVFVAFCSGCYFNRQFCAIEFEIFRRRVEKTGFKHPCVLPVIWDKCELPAVLKQYQFNAHDLPKSYEKEGLRAVRLENKKRYEQTIERLADAIAGACKNPAQPTLPALEEPVEFGTIEASFGMPKNDPGHLHVGVLHGDGPRWEVEIGHAVRQLLERSPTLQQRGWSPMRVDAGAAQRLQALRARQSSVLLISPRDAFDDPHWSAYAQAIDDELAHPEGTCLLLVGIAPGSSPLALHSSLAAILPKTLAKPGSIEHFELSAPSLLQRINSRAAVMEVRALQSAPAARAASPDLESAAVAAGLPLATAPVIRGPGGGS